MGERPTGTVTFLFTDVVGSTRRWQEHPDAMAEALAAHDELVRSAIEEHGGYVFSTAGDAFAAAFSGSPGAVAGAVTAQRALSTADWPGDLRLEVRMGVHTGEAVERGGDYFGPTLNLAARTMSVAHGGQVVVTDATARLLGLGHLNVGHVGLVDLGEHTLRDIDRAVRLHQLTADGLAAEFPPLRTADAARVSLPSSRSSFIGRIDDIARIRRALDEHRLVTLTGAGGCGKTRLAVEVASRDASRFVDGVRFVDLARIGEDAGVAEAFAVAIDFVPDTTAPTDQQVRRRLGDRTSLMVVDNCEHVIDEVAEQVDALLEVCPNVRLLTTSREPLDVDGERVLRVPPLDVDGTDGRPAAELLFLERMTDLGVATDASPDADEAITAICRRLDGLPLAIELAAARTAVLSPVQILERLDDRFSLLTGGRRRTRGRHQTLEATIAWSYDLLDDEEQEALRRISVMPASFDLEVAAAVLDRSPAGTVDLLDSLVARSLVQAMRDDGGSRFRLLETVRSYAHDRLAEHGEAVTTRDRHARHVVDRLDDDSMQLVSSMSAEHRAVADDVLAAIDWARSRGDHDLAARLIELAIPIAIARGAYRRALDVATWASTADDPIARSRAHVGRGYLAMVADSDDTDPLRCAHASLAEAGDHPAPWRGQAHVLVMIYSVFTRPQVCAEHARLARAAVERGEGSDNTLTMVAWLERIDELWRGVDREPDRWAQDAVDAEIDPIILVNVLGVDLLARLFTGDKMELEAHLQNHATVAARQRFLEAASRGEHWMLSYEAIRCAAVAELGRVDEARRALAGALGRVGPDRMPGVEEDVLGAFAWACVAAGESDRAAELLDDTWVIARSPTTIVMITAAQERALGLEIDAERRRSELLRRVGLRGMIRREHRTRRMLDEELRRLGLAPSPSPRSIASSMRSVLTEVRHQNTRCSPLVL